MPCPQTQGSTRPKRRRALLAGVAIVLGLCFVLLAPGHVSASALSDFGQIAARKLSRMLAEAEPLLQRWGYWAVFGALLIEGIGIPAPGLTLLVAACIGAARGDLNVLAVLAVAISGVVIGSQVGWLLGRQGGRRLLERLPINPERLHRIEGLYGRYGAAVVILGPFVEGVRQLNAFMAGLLGLAWPRFVLANLAGAALWAIAWGGGTWFLTTQVEGALSANHHLKPWMIAATALVVALGVVWLVAYARRPGAPAP